MRVLVVAMLLAATAAHAAVEDDLRDGDKYFEEGDWRRAAFAYDRAIAKAPGQVTPQAYGKRAAIYIILKDLKGGLDFVIKAEARWPNAPEVMEQEALLLWETDRRDDAVKVAEKVISLRPETFSNQKLLGEFYSTRDPVKTEAAFEQYLAHRPAELEPTDVLPRVRLGFADLANARAALGGTDDAKAQALYQKAAEQFEYVERKLGKKPNAKTNSDNGLCAAYAGLARWDQAETVCERITADAKHVDPTGSAWFNLATAYLARNRTKQARTAAGKFVELRKTEARGYALVGDAYFADRDWPNALDQYLRAEKLVKPAQQREQVQLTIKLGKTYRRLPASAGANNLALAIDKLTAGLAANPNSLEIAIELGDAYLESRQDAKAAALADKLLTGDADDVPKAPKDQRAALLVIAGKAQFDRHALREARERFEAARELRPGDVQVQRELVQTINEQAFDTKDAKAAQTLLEQALALDTGSAVTMTNLAVFALDRGDCDSAQKHLIRLKGVRGSDSVLVARLLARTYTCQTKPDVKRAALAYADAEKEAKRANAQLALAEIYTEWAPLEWDTELAAAIEKLDSAVAIAAQDPEVGPAAKRNLALALYRRGWRQLREGKATEAAGDFERATRDPSVLKATEPFAFDFSYAIALLDTGRSQEAERLFKSLATRGNQASYLTGPYAKVGAQLFTAYAAYRTQTGAAREQACAELGKLEGELGAKGRELAASCWEVVAADAWKNGNRAEASKALAVADKAAVGEAKRRIELDRTTLALGKDKLNALEAMGGNPPESLVDLGIVYDELGRTKDAYDAWQRARAKGVTARDLQKWIDAKKRIYGL